jgi:hypothetical protein
MASMNWSGPMKSSPVSASFTAWVMKRAFVWTDNWTGSEEPMGLSFLASLTATTLGIAAGLIAIKRGRQGSGVVANRELAVPNLN